MFNYLWPVVLVVLSNTFYQICAKSVPSNINPFASLVVTYLVAALASAIMYMLLEKNLNVFHELKKINWSSVVLGVVIIGLEVGCIYAYKAGWHVSIFQIVQSCVLGIILVFVGRFFYKEALTWNRITGLLICLVGLVFINLK